MNRDYANLKQRIESLYESWESHRLRLDDLLKQLKGS
jgi:hypothetical protein